MSLQKFIIIFITFQLSNLYAQDGFESLGFQAQLSIQDFSNRKASKPVQLNISGSQYFDLDFKPARLSYFGKEINNAGFMRYNGFTDEIEITDSGNVENSELILLKSDKVVPIINNVIYEYLPFRINESNTKIGYLVKIYEGTRIKLYLRKNKQFMEAKIARTCPWALNDSPATAPSSRSPVPLRNPAAQPPPQPARRRVARHR